MEKGLKIWQAIVSLILLGITIGSLIVNLSNKVETQRLRIEYLESSNKDQSLQLKSVNQEMNQKYDQINQKLTDILIALEKKQNRN